ncbi:CvfB family protein [Hydrogenimonas sp.]
MKQRLAAGDTRTLTILRAIDHGLILGDGDGGEVLLPKRYATPDMAVGGEVTVFLYTDSEDRLVATTERPVARVGESAAMRIVATTKHGAFAEWGLPKDLFVPNALQQTPMREGEVRTLTVDIDPKTGRLIGRETPPKGLARARRDTFKRNQPVEAHLFKKTEMGFKAAVEGRYEGLLLHSEIFGSLKVGDRVTAYVKRIRDDGKIDLLGRPIGKKSDTLAADKIVAYLRAHKGVLPLNYKSAPERIEALLGLSRKNFKRALTHLLEKGVIEVKENGTYLKRKGSR